MKHPLFTEVLLTRRQIERRITQMARWVNKEYAQSSNLIIVGLLKGSVPFLAQLIKDIKVVHAIDFMTVSSYQGATSSTGELKVIMDLKQDIRGKDVLLVEDIVDSGLTLTRVIAMINRQQPSSLRTITLLDKPSGRQTPFVPDLVGFTVPHAFLAGFGLDVKEKLRNLPFVGIFDQSKIDSL